MENDNWSACFRACCKSDKVPLAVPKDEFSSNLRLIHDGPASAVYLGRFNNLPIAVKKPKLPTKVGVLPGHQMRAPRHAGVTTNGLKEKKNNQTASPRPPRAHQTRGARVGAWWSPLDACCAEVTFFRTGQSGTTPHLYLPHIIHATTASIDKGQTRKSPRRKHHACQGGLGKER